MSETDGKISLEVLMSWSIGHRDARRLQDEWKMRGWAANDPRRKNSLYITPKLADLLPKCQTRQTLPNTFQPCQTWLPKCQSGLPECQTAYQLPAFMAANPVSKQEEMPSASPTKKPSINSDHW
jgi:hypothetical protein